MPLASCLNLFGHIIIQNLELKVPLTSDILLTWANDVQLGEHFV
jgi:hypothetical protein